MVEVMKHYGFDRFPVVGHDRGGRVGQRLALDHQDKVTHLAVLDIVPTYYLYTHVTIEFVQAYYHWFHQLRPVPIPENELFEQNKAAKERASRSDRVAADGVDEMENIHAMCEDAPRGGVDRPAARGLIQRESMPAVDVVENEDRWAASMSLSRDLERTRDEGQRQRPARRPQPDDRRPDQVIAEVRALLKA